MTSMVGLIGWSLSPSSVGPWTTSTLVFFVVALGGAVLRSEEHDIDGPLRDRVTHYAILSTGPSGGGKLAGFYWETNQLMNAALREYGYLDEAIYRLSEFGITQGQDIDGRSTLSNLRQTLDHLRHIIKEQDDLFIFLIGHGKPAGGDFTYTMVDGDLTATELKELLDRLPTQKLTIALHPCFSGGFIPKISGKGRVIVTSTSDSEVNAIPWAEAFIRALSPGGTKQAVSIKDAYVAGLEPGRQRYGTDVKEHPLLDDNGDGIGHFGEQKVVDGDGRVAADRFLGDRGRLLRFSESAVRTLRKQNSSLILCDRTRLADIFVTEAVYLGKLGGYKDDPGANSTSVDDHRAWALDHDPRMLSLNLVDKYLVQFDRQASSGKAAADHFYAEASARLASYGIDLGNSGTNVDISPPHFEWASRTSIERVRDELEAKVRALIVGASDCQKR